MGVAQRMNLRCAGDVVDHTLIDIVVFTGIAEVLLDTVRVVQEMTGRDFGADLGIGDLETGEVGPHRLVQADFPFVDELHEGESSPCLGHGAALVDGVGRRGFLR